MPAARDIEASPAPTGGRAGIHQGGKRGKKSSVKGTGGAGRGTQRVALPRKLAVQHWRQLNGVEGLQFIG